MHRENARRLSGVRGDDGVAPGRGHLLRWGWGVSLYSAVDLAAAPPLGSGVPVAAGSQFADRRGPGGPHGKDALSSGPVARRCPDTEAKRSRSAALRPGASSSAICAAFPPLPPDSSLPFQRQQNLRSRLFVRERKGGEDPGGKMGALSVPGSAGHCGIKRQLKDSKYIPGASDSSFASSSSCSSIHPPSTPHQYNLLSVCYILAVCWALGIIGWTI